MTCDQLRKDINHAKKIALKGYNLNKGVYTKYSTIPIRGTENVEELFKKVLGLFKKSLIVTGSGDQILEAILYGAKEIHAFDINSLSKYGCALKIAAIEALEYEEFCNFYQLNFPLFLYLKVREYLKEDFLLFWDAIFNSISALDVYCSLFNSMDHRKIINFGFSVYAKQTYNSIKDRISEVQIHYETVNLLDKKFSTLMSIQYDFIYLSNIFYYLSLPPKNFSEFLLKTIFPMLKEDGELFFHYLYGIYNISFSVQFLLRDFIGVDRDKKAVEEFKEYLNPNIYLVNSSGYGRGSGKTDVALSLKK